MLKILRSFNSSETAERASMLNAFVSSVLIEVVAENYRYLMHESAFPAQDMVVDPPLRANERVLSGLFATAISRVSPRSRPEVRVDRVIEEDDIDEEDPDAKNETSAGRVDYLAWHGNQTIAVELKVVQMNIDTALVTGKLQKRWESVNAQAQSAQRFLDGNKLKYPQATSIGLLVVIGRRTVASFEKANERSLNSEEFLAEISAFNTNLTNALQPGFQASYVIPAEFRVARRKRRGADADGVVYTPSIAFLADCY